MSKKQKKANQKRKPAKKIPKAVQEISLSPDNFWKTNLIPILLLILASVLLYISSVSYEHVLDDKMVIVENNYTKEGIKGLKKIFTTDSFKGYLGDRTEMLPGGRYRPLSIATFAIEYEFFGLNSTVGHLINILLYALTGLMLYRLLLILIPPLEKNKWFLSLPFIASFLFILHPIHTEVVANIKGRDEILALLFAIISLYCVLKYVHSKNIFLLIGACVAYLLGVLAKENGLTWILIIPMSLYFFTKSKWSTIGIVFGALLLTTVLYFGIRLNAIGYFLTTGKESQDIMNDPFFGLEAGKKAGTILYTLGNYIKLLIFPHPLTHDYYPYQIPVINVTDWRALLALIVNAGLFIYALLGIRKKSIVSYCILFYFITLSIVSNIVVNIGTTMNDRFVFMPSLGFCIILAYFIARWLPQKLKEKPGELNVIALGLFMFLTVGYVGKTLKRVPDWKNALTLNSAAVKYSPNSARANLFMGVALFENYKIEQDQAVKDQLLPEITYFIDRALEIYPGYGSALTMHSGVLAEHYKKDYDIKKLLDGFTNVLQYRSRTDFTDEYIQYLIDQNRSPDEVKQFLYNIGYSLNMERRKDYETALHYLGFAYQIDPANQNFINAISICYANLGNEAKAQEFRNLLQ